MVMRHLGSLLLAGVAAVGLAGAASAADPQTHVMTIQLPGRGIEQIRYAGTVAPQVVVRPMPYAAFAPDNAFATLDRISAEMDREAAYMLRQVQALAAQPTRATETSVADMPAGSSSYSFVSTMNGGNVCMRSTEITSHVGGEAPQVVTHSSGNCTGLPGGGSSVLPTAQPPAPTAPEMLQTRAVGAHPYAGLIRQATWQ
jgi:hypothetical protein